MRPLLRSRPASIGLAALTAAALALGFVPLFGGPGYESALGSGVLLAFGVPLAVALDQRGALLAPLAALERALLQGLACALAVWLTTLLHGLRVGFCEAAAGSTLFALGPFAGALLGATWGAVAAELARRRKRPRLVTVLLAVAAPLASIAVSVGRFFTSPMIFAYDPFVGFFSGTLYDTVIEPAGLTSYRVGSAATLVAALALAVHLRRDEGERLRLTWPGRPWVAAAGAAALCASIAVTASGPRLGHWTTAASIADTLGARMSGLRCDVIHARALRVADMKRLTDDCDAHVAAAEVWFGAPGPARVTAFVFESAAQKGALMGAADTFIAKPWRREVYIQNASYPHAVIGHELVHAVSSAYARGPFRVAGSVGGLVPNPGLIEGVAVAAEPREGELLPRQWAKAMKDLTLLPPLGNLFALGFLGENAGVAYTVSGAFVGWVRDRFGAPVLRGWYGGEDLAALTGLSWPALEKAWHEDLDGAVLPEAARAVAKARFDRPAIFGRRCPHAIDACKGRADRARGAGDYEGALAAYGEVLGMDPRDNMARVHVALTRVRMGRVDEGAAELDRLAGDKDVPRHVRDRALDERADLALGLDQGEEAARRYRELMSRAVDDDALRNFEVKIAAAEDPRFRPAIVALLVGTPARGTDRTLALTQLGDLTGRLPEEGLPHYLLARQFYNAAQYEDALPRLDRALAGTLRIDRVRVESERLRLVCACALGDRRLAAEAYVRYASRREVSQARREAARSLVTRCTASPAPPVPGYDEPAPSGGALRR